MVMQHYGNDQILYSPSDLVTFLGCHHASFLDVKALSEDMDKAEASTTAQLLQQKGLEHEAAYLQQLKDEGKSVVEIPKDRNLQDLVQWVGDLRLLARVIHTREVLQKNIYIIVVIKGYAFIGDISMCGLIGFFVGCDLAVVCPKRKICTASKSYRSSFKNWDTRASVRSRPQQVNEVKSALFPERFVPVLSHRLVQQLDNKSRELLQEAALYRFLNFTHKLELLVVNTVTANIALGRYNTDFSNEIRLDAHRIYTDEAYHALFSFELMQKIKERNISCSAFNEDMPAFVRRTQNIVIQHDSNGRALLELLTVIVSEMLITSTLREATNVPDLDHGVSAMITDHAKDEARHHAFYKQVLLDLWPRLSDRNRSLALTHIHSLLMAYTTPDNDAIANELQAVGLTIDQAHQVIAETYDPRSVSEYAIACGGTILSTFEELTNPLEFGLLSEQFSTESSLEGSF